jgi:hypothetical protein
MEARVGAKVDWTRKIPAVRNPRELHRAPLLAPDHNNRHLLLSWDKVNTARAARYTARLLSASIPNGWSSLQIRAAPMSRDALFHSSTSSVNFDV